MSSLLQQAEDIQRRAWNIIEKTNVIDIWQNIGAEINLIGSLKTGLLINHFDIDFHIYTRPFNMADSFSAIAKFAENPGVRHISYTNLLNAEDQCLEWHATYIGEFEQEWTFDMIHIHEDSPYVGYFEKVNERILSKLTAESKESILTIKSETSKVGKLPAIKIVQAVLQEKISNTEAFLEWYKTQDKNIIEQWMPGS